MLQNAMLNTRCVAKTEYRQSFESIFFFKKKYTRELCIVSSYIKKIIIKLYKIGQSGAHTQVTRFI